ncbi:MAG: hypothetical protein IT361_01745 [Gemmatimonadaceae bacterium]|nr:hypothetical protein [Gemmatimonadaceae bacterium]
MTGCSSLREDLLKADDPDIISPDAVKSAAGADALRLGALSRLRDVGPGGGGSNGTAWTQGGLLVDEWKSANTFFQHNETDERKVQDNNSVVLAMLRDAYRARTSAREAINGLREFKPSPASNIGQMYFATAFAEMTLAENFCNGTPLGDASTGAIEYGPPLSNQAVFTLALAHADSGLALATATDAATVAINNQLRVLKGRILINLGRFTDVTAVVSSVPTSFIFNATFALTSGDNAVWSMNTNQKRFVVGDSVDPAGRIANAIPFVSARDPRVPTQGSSTGTSSQGRGFDNFTNMVRQDVFQRSDAIPYVSGIDARLQEAEVLLRADNYTGMLAILNALRASPQSLGTISTPAMAALPLPATRDAAINLYFREKAFWTFSRGQRLPDLRRLVRQYGRTEPQVFPTGTFFKTNQPYGDAVNFPVMREELANPNFTGCTDRKA